MRGGWAAIGYLSPCARSWFVCHVADRHRADTDDVPRTKTGEALGAETGDVFRTETGDALRAETGEVPGTVTYPRDQRGYQCGSDPIAAIGVFGKGIALPMLLAQDSFVLGRAAICGDLRVDEQYLASMHARIDRVVGSRASIRVTNVSNGKNDIVYNGDIAEQGFEMGAGEWFMIGETKYFALNEEMRLARPRLMEVLGAQQHNAIDDLLISAVRESARHILLVGEPGCDQDRLGRVVHEVSHRRHNRFHVLPEKAKLDSGTRQDIQRANSGTILVQLPSKGKLDQRLVAALVDPAAKLRLIICAYSRNKAEASFPPDVIKDAKAIAIPPLRERTNEELQELLDQWFIARRSELRFSALRPEVREGLLSHTWPDNLKELREAADHFARLAHYRSGRQADRDSQLTRGKLRGWIKRLHLKLKFPLIPRDDDDDDSDG